MRFAIVATVAFVAFVAFAASATPAIAKKFKPEGHPGNGKVKVEESSKPPHGPYFSQKDDWAVRKVATTPVAWTGLPPGIAKKVARGKPLPPGIAKKLSPQMLATLPQRQGYEYAQVGTDVVLIETATRLVVDVLKDVFN
jgi:Ni/Co efflux regulator RcnB